MTVKLGDDDMANPFETVPLPPELDKRRKLTVDHKEQIRSLRSQGWTYSRLASEYGISSTMAQRICKPEYAAAQDAIRRQLPIYDKDRQYQINKRNRARRKAMFDPVKRQWRAL